MTKVKSKDTQIRFIAISDLEVHPVIQRECVAAHVNRIQKNFNMNVFGEIYVVLDDETGKYLIWDGQHRFQAAKNLFKPTDTLPCKVWTMADAKELAEFQYIINRNVKRWTYLTLWKMENEAEHDDVRQIESVLASHKLKIGNSKTHGIVNAAKALREQYRRHGKENIDKTLHTIVQAWGYDPDAYHGTIIKGLSEVIGRYNGELNLSELSSRLSKSCPPQTILRKARGFKDTTGVSVTTGAAMAFTQEYNTKRTKKRLPNWV